MWRTPGDMEQRVGPTNNVGTGDSRGPGPALADRVAFKVDFCCQHRSCHWKSEFMRNNCYREGRGIRIADY